MRLALNNIQKPKEPISRRVQIVKKINATKYQTVDAYGRLFNANSTVDWKPRTYVVIQNGEIIRATGAVEAPKVYKG
jgi:hypothetical protein